jgi:hypothetical protein
VGVREGVLEVLYVPGTERITSSLNSPCRAGMPVCNGHHRKPKPGPNNHCNLSSAGNFRVCFIQYSAALKRDSRAPVVKCLEIIFNLKTAHVAAA